MNWPRRQTKKPAWVDGVCIIHMKKREEKRKKKKEEILCTGFSASIDVQIPQAAMRTSLEHPGP